MVTWQEADEPLQFEMKERNKNVDYHVSVGGTQEGY